MIESEPIMMEIQITDSQIEILEIRKEDDVEEVIDRFCDDFELNDEQRIAIYKSAMVLMESEGEEEDDGGYEEEGDYYSQGDQIHVPVNEKNLQKLFEEKNGFFSPDTVSLRHKASENESMPEDEERISRDSIRPEKKNFFNLLKQKSLASNKFNTPTQPSNLNIQKEELDQEEHIVKQSDGNIKLEEHFDMEIDKEGIDDSNPQINDIHRAMEDKLSNNVRLLV